MNQYCIVTNGSGAAAALSRLSSTMTPVEVAATQEQTGELALYARTNVVATVDVMLAVVNSGGTQLDDGAPLPYGLVWCDAPSLLRIIDAYAAQEEAALAVRR